jgi:outer membrane biogenesis lipoprotein LolB
MCVGNVCNVVEFFKQQSTQSWQLTYTRLNNNHHRRRHLHLHRNHQSHRLGRYPH